MENVRIADHVYVSSNRWQYKWITAINNTNSSMEKEDWLRDEKLYLITCLIFMLEQIALFSYKVNC